MIPEKRNYRFINDGDFVNKPYMEMIKNSANAAFLGGINDGDSVSFSPDWLRIVSLWMVEHTAIEIGIHYSSS